VERWLDPESKREVWVCEAADSADWPAKTPWSCAGFGLLLLADHLIDAAPLAERAIDQGLAVACVWGPAGAVVEDAIDDVAAQKASDVVTTSHPYETIEEVLEIFLMLAPATAREATCQAWCVLALDAEHAKTARRALEHRGARRL
jgi:hypothetical protein